MMSNMMAKQNESSNRVKHGEVSKWSADIVAGLATTAITDTLGQEELEGNAKLGTTSEEKAGVHDLLGTSWCN